jgi:hypothetical protein
MLMRDVEDKELPYKLQIPPRIEDVPPEPLPPFKRR